MSGIDSFRTVKNEEESRLVVERSEFIARVKKVSSNDEAREWIKHYKDEYSDASHNCSAYICGIRGELEFSDDNGEPHGSAGRPILGAIKSLEVTNVLVVVTRYYGGKNLGIRGLIEAYSTTARNALQESEIIDQMITRSIHINCSYKNIDRINYILSKEDARVINKEYFENIDLDVEIVQSKAEELINSLKGFANHIHYN